MEAESFVKVDGFTLEEALKGWCHRGLEVLASKSGSAATEYLNGLEPSSIRWNRVSHDLETSRHTGDDRDTYLVEGESTDHRISASFTLDIVHEDGEVDRFGHTLFFQIIKNGHDIEGSVSLPLDGEEMSPFVSIWKVKNAV